ncbi:WD40 repeat domain-containing serine/threonine protein kinase [Nonomuraea polychroma]|uniref:WD40 repeat domain-containing serine/threonine protein kinase n=1 Tax=Nonomuraea polychroma TaxID=46176 RepID=UPI003D9243E4
MPDIQPLKPGDPRSVDRYRIAGRIGEGGQGTVFLGVDDDGGEVAIKIMTSVDASDTESRLRFQREIEVASKVASFCTVRVLGHGVTDDRLYMVSEYVAGESLQQHVLARGPLDASALTRLAVNTSTALLSIHNTGIIHRDFKPSNVLLGPDGPYVIDFGVARAFDDKTVTVSGVLGTPAYMSPEQLAGERVTPASDMFSWGLTMTFAALGRPLFSGSTIAAMAITLRQDEVDLSGITEPLRSIIASCLVRSPEARPTAREVLNSLIGPPSDPRAADRRRPVGRPAPGPAAFAPPDSLIASFVPPDSAPVTVPPAQAEIPDPISQPTDATPAAPSSDRRAGRLAIAVAVLVALTGAGAVVVPRLISAPAAVPSSAPASAGFGTPIGWRPTGHFSAVTAVGAAEVAGRLVAVTASEDGTVRQWDARTAQPIGAPLAGHGDWVRAVATTTVNGKPVAVTGSDDKTVRMWDLATGRLIGTPLTGHTGAVLAVATTTVNGKPVAVTSGDDKTVRMWDLATGRPIGTPLTGHTGAVLAVATTTVNGKPVAVSAGKDRVLRLWDLETGEPVGRARAGHTDWVRALAAMPDAIVSASDDKTVRVWDLASNRVSTIRDLPDVVISLAAIKTGTSWTLLGAGRDGMIRGWDTTGKPVGAPLTGHTGYVMAVTATVADGVPLAFSGGADKSLRTWDLAKWSASAVAGGNPGHSGAVRAVALATVSGRLVAVSGGVDKTVRMSDPSMGTVIGPPLLGHTGQIMAMAAGVVDGKPVAVSGDAAGVLRMWRLDTGAALGKPLIGHKGSVNAVTLINDLVVSGGADGRLHFWNAVTGAPAGPPVSGHRKPIRALASAVVNGRPVAISASEDHEMRLWDITGGKQIGAPLIGHDGVVLAVATGVVDGRPVAVSAGEDRTLRRWDLITGTAIGAPLTGHADWVRALTVSGERVVSAGDDRSLRVWNLRTGEAAGKPISGHAGPVYALAAGQVGGTPVAVSAGTDWTVRTWSIRGE